MYFTLFSFICRVSEEKPAELLTLVCLKVKIFLPFSDLFHYLFFAFFCKLTVIKLGADLFLFLLLYSLVFIIVVSIMLAFLRVLDFALISVISLNSWTLLHQIFLLLGSLSSIPIMHMLHLLKLSYGSWMLFILFFPISVCKASTDLTLNSMILSSTMRSLLMSPSKSTTLHLC